MTERKVDETTVGRTGDEQTTVGRTRRMDGRGA